MLVQFASAIPKDLTVRDLEIFDSLDIWRYDTMYLCMYIYIHIGTCDIANGDTV